MNPLLRTALVALAVALPALAQTDVPSSESLLPRSGAAGSPSATGFFLVIVLCLFGYHLYSNFALSSRIDRLEERLRKRGKTGDDDLVPFSWDSVMRSLESGLPFLGPIALSRPGLVLVGADSAELAAHLRTNILRGILGEEDLLALAVCRSTRSEELGSRLLSIEAGLDWGGLSPERRAEEAGRLGVELDHLEDSLFVITDLELTPDQLFESCRELGDEGEIGGIVADSLDVFLPDRAAPEARGRLERLHLVGLRCHAPIFLVVPRDDPAWSWGRSHEDLLTAVVEFRQDGSTVVPVYHKFPGDTPGVKLQLAAESGALAEARA